MELEVRFVWGQGRSAPGPGGCGSQVGVPIHGPSSGGVDFSLHKRRPARAGTLILSRASNKLPSPEEEVSWVLHVRASTSSNRFVAFACIGECASVHFVST